MLGKQQKKPTSTTSDIQTKISTIIGPGAVFNGNLNAPETTRVDGIINGNCNCGQNLILGPEGQIKGNITAQNVTISGKVEGDVNVHGKLELYSTGRLVGNVTARSLVIDEDAYFDGRCSMAVSANPPVDSSVSSEPSETDPE